MPLAAFPKCYLDLMDDPEAMSVDQWIDLSSEIDVDGLEFYWGFVDKADSREWERWRVKVEAQGRCVPMLCYSSDFTKPEAEDRLKEIEAQKRAIRAASVLGADYCRVLSGQRRPEVSRDQGMRWVRECIMELIPYAESQKVALILENHYKDHFWLYPEFAQKMDDFLDLVESLPDSPWFGVNYDPSNAIIAGDDPLALLEKVKHRVKTMHASDRYFSGGTLEDLHRLDAHPQKGYVDIVTHGVIGRGLNDYDRIFGILKKQGFSGWVSIEDGPDPAVGLRDLQESALFLRKKMNQHGLS